MVAKKEYLVFVGHNQYPLGGMSDFFMFASKIDKIKEMVEDYDDDFDWCQIVNRKTLDISVTGSRRGFFKQSEWIWKDERRRRRR